MSRYSGIHTIDGVKAIWLQNVGYVAAKPIEEFREGDIIAYNDAGTGIFISKKEVSPKFWEIVTKEEDDGKIYHSKVKKGTLKPYYKPRKKVAKVAPKPPAGSGVQTKAAAPKARKVFLKGGAKEKTSMGVTYLINVVNDTIEINTVGRFRSWDDVSRSMGGLYGFQSYQGVPMTQEELTAHYPELKPYTGLTKAKIGSAKVWFKNVDMPLVVQYKGYAYMVAPTIAEADAFRQVPDSMTKPKLTAEQRKYLDAHKKEEVAGCWQEIEFFQVGIEEAIREGKRLQKQGKRVQIGEFAPTGGRPLYTVMVLVGGSAGAGVAAKPKPKAAAKPAKKPTPNESTRARELGKARALGKAGYRAGKQAPAQDAKIIELCSNRGHSQMMELMGAWSKGWHAEHQIETDKELERKGIITPRMVAAKPKPAAKPPRTPAPAFPTILTPAPAAASDMASVPVRLGGGGIAPIPGVGAGVAPAKKRRQPAAKPAAKPRARAAAPKPAKKAKTAAKPAKAKNGKTVPELTAAQKKRLAAKGSVTVKRGGKFVTVTR